MRSARLLTITCNLEAMSFLNSSGGSEACSSARERSLRFCLSALVAGSGMLFVGFVVKVEWDGGSGLLDSVDNGMSAKGAREFMICLSESELGSDECG